MLNLFNYLSEKDNKIFENYIHLYGVKEDYKGNKEYLKYWAESKKKLFHLLGGNLILKFPYSYKKSPEEIKSELAELWDTNLSNDIYFAVKHSVFEYDDMDEKTKNDIIKIFRSDNFFEGKTLSSVKYKDEKRNRSIQIPVGMTTIRAWKKVIDFLELPLNDEYDEFRIAHSMIFNEKYVKGNMCISIHPMDFVTMSDNSSWTSCMTWQRKGCYHLGTVEMMNSNNVICAYIEREAPFYFAKDKDELHAWNDKKWRQLFYCTKDILMGGKSYPYQNLNFTEAVLNKLKELAETNWKCTYKYGIEEYHDMDQVGSLYRMDNQKMYARNRAINKKQSIIFHTNAMYNDMFNDHDGVTKYLCYRNPIDRTIVLTVSGKAPCLCCDNLLDVYNDDLYYYGDTSYNDRYANPGDLLCDGCKEDRFCDHCSSYGIEKTVKINGVRYCKECFNYFIAECPDCGKVYDVRNRDGYALFARLQEEYQHDSFFWSSKFDNITDIDNNKNSIVHFNCCAECAEKYIKEGIFKKEEQDCTRRYSVIYPSTKIYDETDSFLTDHLLKNLKKPNYIDFL